MLGAKYNVIGGCKLIVYLIVGTGCSAHQSIRNGLVMRCLETISRRLLVDWVVWMRAVWRNCAVVCEVPVSSTDNK